MKRVYFARMAARPLASTAIAALSAVLSAACLSACSSSPTPLASSAGPGTVVQPVGEPIHLVGLLTLKGPEVGAWWALTVDGDQVWRLQPANAEQADSFRQWQNHRLSVDGVRNGFYLRTPQVKVEKALLLP
jgi:hypothetical protein